MTRLTRRSALGGALALAACAPARAPFTLAEQRAATIPGIPDARAWADGTPATLAPLGLAPAQVAARRPGPIDVLALSSGGPAGAYAAGVLVGWTAAGTRPAFDVVTGVSSGALIAPFAFAGPAGDAALRSLWEGGLAADLGRGLDLTGPLRGRGLVDPRPLRDLLDAYVDAPLLAAVARGHREGRRLVAVTTNLDAQRPVAWNLGAIAASGRPEASRLVRDVLLASASVPLALPPVLIEADAGGRPIEELHVDGGVSEQVFAIPRAFQLDPAGFAIPAGREARLWVLVSYVISPEFGVTPRGPFGLGARAYGTLIKSDVASELIATAAAAREAGLDLRLASLTASPPWDPRDPFGPGFLGPLFAQGEREGREGRAFGRA